MPDHSDIGEEERAQIALLGGQIPHTCKSHIFSCVEQYDAYAPHTNTNRNRISLSVSFNDIHKSTHIYIHGYTKGLHHAVYIIYRFHAIRYRI